MFDRMEHAIERWEALRRTDRVRGLPSEHVDYWIERDVVPVVGELIVRPSFRRVATWSLTRLAVNADSEERAAIDAVDRALVETARAIRRVLARSEVTAALVARYGDEDDGRPASGEVLEVRIKVNLDADGETDPGSEEMQQAMLRRPFQPFSLHTELCFLEGLGRRPWRDLVDPRDYFGPASDLNLVDRVRWFGPGTEMMSLGEFLPYFQPSLQQPEDFIVRCLERRASYWERDLNRTWVRVDSALSAAMGTDSRPRREVREARERLEPAIARLRQITVEAPDAPVRRAACCLVQVLAAYRPSADFSWLGETAAVVPYASELRDRIRAGRDVASPASIAMALCELRSLYRSEVDVEERIQAACETGGLVIVDGGDSLREVYWRRCKVAAGEWFKKRRAWTLLLALAESARLGDQGVSEGSIRVSLPDARRDLKSLLPTSLFELTTGGRVHRLKLTPDRVEVLNATQEMRLADERSVDR